MARDISPVLPAQFDIIYYVRRCGGLPHEFFPQTYTSSVDLADIVFVDPGVVNAGQPLGVPGAIQTFRDTALALYSTAAGPATNQANLDALALQMATDYANWQAWSNDTVFNGIAAIEPCGLWDVIEFRYDAQDQWTRATSQPWNGQPIEYQHQDPGVGATACQGYDRFPAILADIPGAPSGQSYQGLISLEDGRLVLTYDNETAVPCGCGVMLCGCVCITVLSECGVLIPGLSLSVTSTDFSASCTSSINYVYQINRVLPGSGYTSPPTVSFVGGLGVGGTIARAMATVVAGVITAINVTAFGSNYTGVPTVVITGGGGAGATATATVVNGLVTAVTVTAGGAGYTSVTVTGGGGMGATATWTLTAGVVTSVDVVDGGAGYTAAPAVIFAGGGGTGAAATSTIAGGAVTGFVITNGGTGYSTPPTVSLGGPGTGALAASVITGNIQAVIVTGSGSGFTSTPTAVFSVGVGATATIVMAGEVCIQTTANATYTVTSSSPEYATQTVGSNVVTNCDPTVRTITMMLASGYSCSPDSCCPAGEQVGPPYPDPFFAYPTNVFLNDGFGMVMLTKNPAGAGTAGTYSACVMRVASTATTSCTVLATDADLNVPVAFQLECAGTQWQLLIETPISPFNGTTGSGVNEWPDSLGTCGTVAGNAAALNCAGANTVNSQTSMAIASSCLSFGVSFSFTFDGTTADAAYSTLSQIYGTIPFTIPVTA